MKTDLNSKANNNNLYIALGIIVIIFVLGASLFAINKNREDRNQEDNRIAAQKKDDQDKMEREQKLKDTPATQPSKSTAQDILTLGSLAGSYTGKSASLLTNSLVFPTSNMEITKDNSFKFEASGLDLSLLGLETLKVNGVFPKVSALVSGSIVPGSDKITYDFRSTGLVLDFKVNEVIVDPVSKASLIQALAKFNLIIPTVSPEKPAILNADVVTTVNTIKVISTKNSSLVVSFDGTKNSI
jgi:hypothetical protein